MPNLAAEFYLGNKFSISAGYAHAWWASEAKSFYWRYYGADVSLRWWFGKPTRIKPLQGHHIGLDYQILTYDFQLGHKGIMGGMPKGNLVDRANHIVATVGHGLEVWSMATRCLSRTVSTSTSPSASATTGVCSKSMMPSMATLYGRRQSDVSISVLPNLRCRSYGLLVVVTTIRKKEARDEKISAITNSYACRHYVVRA